MFVCTTAFAKGEQTGLVGSLASGEAVVTDKTATATAGGSYAQMSPYGETLPFISSL